LNHSLKEFFFQSLFLSTIFSAVCGMVDRLPPEVGEFLGATNPAVRDAAWDRFVASYSRLILHVARSVFRDADEAMDAYTCCLERLRADGGRRLSTFDSRNNSKFSTWLVVVARRMCLDCLRQQRGRIKADAGGTGGVGQEQAMRRRLLELAGETAALETLPDPGLDPAQETVKSESLRLLEQVLAELSPSDRLLLSLRFEDDLSASEIAKVVGLPSPFHVYRRLNRLLPELRKRLNGRGIVESEL